MRKNCGGGPVGVMFASLLDGLLRFILRHTFFVVFATTGKVQFEVSGLTVFLRGKTTIVGIGHGDVGKDDRYGLSDERGDELRGRDVGAEYCRVVLGIYRNSCVNGELLVSLGVLFNKDVIRLFHY